MNTAIATRLRTAGPGLLAIAVVLCTVDGPARALAGFSQVGIYADETPTVAAVTADPGDILTIYVVLDQPHNPHVDEDCANVGCYSFRIDLSENLQLLANREATAVAPDKRPECAGVCYDLRTCFGALLPVGDDGHITLRSFVVRYLGPGPGEIRLRQPLQEILAGEMDFWYRDADQTGWMLPMYPSSGDFETPVFVVNGDQVGTVGALWGHVKASYR